MYRFSRAIYRELAGEIIEDSHQGRSRQPRASSARAVRPRSSGWQPTVITSRGRRERLFCDIRMYFPMSAQRRVYAVVERYLAFADEFLRNQPQNGFDIYGNPMQCRASTRKGTPCQRMPLPHNGYCPSHQHLAETEDLAACSRWLAA